MNINKAVLGTLCVLISSICFAGTMGVPPLPNTWGGVLTLSLGPAWTNPEDTQTIYFSPTFPQTYVAASNTHTIGTGEIFLGLQKPIVPMLQGQLGLALAATTNVQLRGDIWQDGDPEFNNFFYEYKIGHSHVAIRGKLLADVMPFVQPYVSASVGVGFNHAYHYTDTPKLFEVSPEPPFQPHTTTAFTYTLDAGLQKMLNDHWSIGVGYEFADWGASHLGPALSQVSGNGLKINHLYTNELQFNLSVTI